MHTVCFSKLLSGFTGFLMAGKKHGTPVTGQKSHLKFNLKIDQISKLFSLLSSAKLKKRVSRFRLQSTFILSQFYNFFKSSQYINTNWWWNETYIPK